MSQFAQFCSEKDAARLDGIMSAIAASKASGLLGIPVEGYVSPKGLTGKAGEVWFSGMQSKPSKAGAMRCTLSYRDKDTDTPNGARLFLYSNKGQIRVLWDGTENGDQYSAQDAKARQINSLSGYIVCRDKVTVTESAAPAAKPATGGKKKPATVSPEIELDGDTEIELDSEAEEDAEIELDAGEPDAEIEDSQKVTMLDRILDLVKAVNRIGDDAAPTAIQIGLIDILLLCVDNDLQEASLKAIKDDIEGDNTVKSLRVALIKSVNAHKA